MLGFMVPIMAVASEAKTFSLSDILSNATELMTWVVTNMASVLNFITGNPLILVLFFITLVSFAVGLLFRIWKSVG